MPGDGVALDEVDEVAGRVTGQCRLHEVRVGGEVAVGGGVEVGEVAAPTARDEDFLARLVGVIDQQDALATLASHQRRHETRRAGTQDDDINLLHG